MTNVERLQVPTTRIEGFVDARDGTRLFGWAWDRLHPEDRLVIEAAGLTAAADLPRPDLAANGIGDGRHAFAFELPEDGDVDVVAVSPSTGERIPLQPRAPEAEGAQTVALLRRVAGAIDLLGRGQRQLGAALGAKPAAPEGVAALRQSLAEIGEAQRELQKQQDCMEVFLVRFDSMLRQMAERLDAQPPPPAGAFARFVNFWSR